jgi:hypothetical protein
MHNVRLNLRMLETTRQKIRAADLIRRLQLFALHEKDKIQGKMREVKMTSDQVRAAFGLLRKIIPDLQCVEFTGEVGVNHQASKDFTRVMAGAIADAATQLSAASTYEQLMLNRSEDPPQPVQPVPDSSPPPAGRLQ